MSKDAIRARAGFTAVELGFVLAIVMAVVGAGTSAMLPGLRKASLSESLATIEEACRSARHLAMAERDAETDYYGVVLYRDGGRNWVAITQGDVASRGTILVDDVGVPRFRAQLPESVTVFAGVDHDGAAHLADGAEVGWLYHHRSGYLSARNGLNITPTFLGVKEAELASKGLAGASILLGSLSLRTRDGALGRSITIYASGILATEEL